MKSDDVSNTVRRFPDSGDYANERNQLKAKNFVA